MTTVETIVIGGGQAGLAVSRCLTGRGIDHVVLERGRVAESWRSERWDSLRLLTPNWQTRLPGWRYAGSDPDGFMTAAEVTGYLDDYARSFGAPVTAGAEVAGLVHDGIRYRVETGRGTWRAPTVVIATGHCQAPLVPEIAGRLPRAIRQVTAMDYRNPGDLPEGGVLVVGASASGVQIADEIHRSGRPVTLAAGRHTRMPRRYRGRDILWWMDRAGILSERAEDMPDIAAARRQPSLQLAGRSDGRPPDLASLRDAGVRLAGRLVSIDAGTARFAPDLAATTADAEARLARLLARIDAFIDGAPEVAGGPPDRPAAFVAGDGIGTLDLAREGIRTVVWATGHRRAYPWLKVPVLDAAAEIRHRGGVTPAPGLFVMGLRFMRRRNSSFIDGVGDDARFVAGRIVGALSAGHHLAA